MPRWMERQSKRQIAKGNGQNSKTAKLRPGRATFSAASQRLRARSRHISSDFAHFRGAITQSRTLFGPYLYLVFSTVSSQVWFCETIPSRAVLSVEDAARPANESGNAPENSGRLSGGLTKREVVHMCQRWTQCVHRKYYTSGSDEGALLLLCCAV